ncbi:MAG: family 1 glycosylhydrolase, partial [Pseudomonadota bacterium]
NYYTRNVVAHDAACWPLRAAPLRQTGSTHTETGWEVFAQGLTDVLLWVKQRYGDIPLYVTENGAAFYDPPKVENGRIEDPLRVSYLKAHVAALAAAIAQGVDLRGYMVWSLLDNLEWALGFSKRFGIVHVDFETQQRTPKESARVYSRLIASNGAGLDEEDMSPRPAATIARLVPVR